MNERPITNEPGWESIDLPTSLAYNELIQHETLRVAVCGMLESPMASLPESLRQRMRGEFRKRLAGYRDLVRRNMNKQGAPFHDPYGSKVGAFNYVDISNRIERLAAQLG